MCIGGVYLTGKYGRWQLSFFAFRTLVEVRSLYVDSCGSSVFIVRVIFLTTVSKAIQWNCKVDRLAICQNRNKTHPEAIRQCQEWVAKELTIDYCSGSKNEHFAQSSRTDFDTYMLQAPTSSLPTGPWIHCFIFVDEKVVALEANMLL